MKKIRNNNGLTVIYDKQPTKSISIQITVKVGSNNENNKNNGISHFIEHMLFEGTKKRTNEQISNEIESLGGEFNAATSSEMTYYYIKILNKHFDKALDILSDIIQYPIFNKKMIEKERKVILNEINLVDDEPRHYQWILFQKNIFTSSAKNPTYGKKEIVASLTKQDLIDYYKTYYIPNNIIITIVGNIKEPFKKTFLKFKNFKKTQNKKVIIREKQNKYKKIVEKQNNKQSYLILGYKTPTRKSKESYILDVVQAHLGRGQSGRLFNEIRGKRGLAYDVGIHHEPGIDLGIIAAYVSTNKKNLPKIINLIKKEFKNLQKMNEKELKESKTCIEGDFALENEDTQKRAAFLGFLELADKAESINTYIKKINSVTLKEIKQLAKKTFTNNYTLTILEQIT